MSYPFGSIEKKWQALWAADRSFRTPEDRSRPKYYILDMFPYPSGTGLHVGHPEGYTATDIIARYKRLQGFNVLHPMGWDAFGLPAERHAMQTGIHPRLTTEKNINAFRRQLQSLGFSYDWEREINTTDKKYYKWTQWIFLQLFNSFYDKTEERARPIDDLPIPKSLQEKNKAKERETYINEKRLAYIAEMPVNWCAGLGTVLANEEVNEWVDKGYTVERRPMRQWMLRITAYAERLLDDLKHVDWPQGTLELQKNWIGKSEGAEVNFSLQTITGRKSSKILRVFTTRPDTLFGVTYMVLAPEHPCVKDLITKETEQTVKDYVREASFKSDLDRQVQGEKSEKSGVFTGGYSRHPLTGDAIPVWIADYVLMSYGTGAVMAVPAHDERDYDFARAFNLPVRYVIEPAKAKHDDWRKDGAYTLSGINFDSDFLNGMSTADAKEKMIRVLEEKKIGTRKVNYRLRDWLFSRQRYWGEPIPISFDSSGSMISGKDTELPLILPDSDDFQPAETGESPLANIKSWAKYKEGRKTLQRETNTMPQWAGSCWYYLRFLSPDFKEALVDPEEEKYWMGSGGVDLYIGGAEHAVLHLLYARFWHKFLYDMGHVTSVEPFRKLVHQGLIMGADNRKMSKSLGNVVSPDDVISHAGADAFRLYEMFMGPLEQMKPWATKGIEGTLRFLDRVWRLYTLSSDRDTDQSSDADHIRDSARIDPLLLEEPPEDRKKDRERLLHATIKKTGEDIERLSFNTAISQLMIFVNETLHEKKIGRQAARDFLLILSPFAPHIAEELWQKLEAGSGNGNGSGIQNETWPSYDESKIVVEEFEAVFQVNGKVRARAMMPSGSDDATLKKTALENESVLRFMEGKEPRKVIVVKGKLVNVVV